MDNKYINENKMEEVITVDNDFILKNIKKPILTKEMMNKKIKEVDFKDYYDNENNTLDIFDENNTNENFKLGILYLEGAIVDDDSDSNKRQITYSNFEKQIKKLIDDSSVKAILLRIDSPGGSAQVSELIYQSINHYKKIKPIYCSFADIAASGGYYIASACDKIFCNEETITGSIGIFTILLKCNQFADKIGVSYEEITTHNTGHLFNPFHKLTDNEKQIIQNYINNGYDTFLSRVSNGRNKSKEHIHEIAQGRVWNGLDAKNIGLVDYNNNLRLTVDYIMKLHNLKTCKVYSLYHKEFDLFHFLLDSLETKFAMSKYFTFFNSLNNYPRSTQNNIPQIMLFCPASISF